MWKKFFEKPKTAIYRGALGWVQIPTEELFASPQSPFVWVECLFFDALQDIHKLGEKPKDALGIPIIAGDCADVRQASPKRKITFATYTFCGE